MTKWTGFPHGRAQGFPDLSVYYPFKFNLFFFRVPQGDFILQGKGPAMLKSKTQQADVLL